MPSLNLLGSRIGAVWIPSANALGMELRACGAGFDGEVRMLLAEFKKQVARDQFTLPPSSMSSPLATAMASRFILHSGQVHHSRRYSHE